VSPTTNMKASFLPLATALIAPFSPVHRDIRLGRACVVMSEADQPTLGDVPAFVQALVSGGTPKVAIEVAFAQALVAAKEPPPPPPTKPQLDLTKPEKPATVTDAKSNFRDAYAILNTSPNPMRASTFKFASFVLESSCVWGFQYSRVFAVGLSALCDTFLQQGLTEGERQATRAAICFGLGLDAAQVAEDARALTAVSVGGVAGAEILKTEDFTAIAQTRAFKFTYTFGVGLIITMQLTGESITEGTISAWCDALKLKCERSLQRDYVRPLSIDGIGRFSFETPGVPEAASLQSIGEQGSF